MSKYINADSKITSLFHEHKLTEIEMKTVSRKFQSTVVSPIDIFTNR